VAPPDVDLGSSDINGEPVTDALKQRLPVTIELLVLSQILALALAIPIGVLAARRPNGIFDKASTAVGFVFLAIPPFVFAFVLIGIFAVGLHWTPATGYTGLTENPAENLRSLILPALALAAGEVAVFSRLLRTDLMATLQEDYIMMAKAKGLTSRRIMWRHAFRPSLFSLITVLGLRMGALIGGAIILESVFVINGIGLYAIKAISNRDYIPLQGAIIVVATGYVFINFGVDLFYAVIDPRIRHARSLA
jgi:peptide/nickel transport system permease protein